MEHLKITIKGKHSLYAEIIAEQGYCFYDIDSEEKQYFERIFTPITDTEELKRKYVVVQGNAEELNAELEKEREIEEDDKNIF